MFNPAKAPSAPPVDRDDPPPWHAAGPIHCRRGTRLARRASAVREGNVLRIWIKDEDGRTLIDIPELLGIRGGASDAAGLGRHRRVGVRVRAS